MLFPQLEKYKNQGKESDELLINVIQFLSKIWSENINLNERNAIFNYERFANEYHLSKEPALAILHLCQKENILHSVYRFYCPTNDDFLDDFNSVSEIPDLFECEFHDGRIEEHKSIDCPVDILFGFTESFLQNVEEYLY